LTKRELCEIAASDDFRVVLGNWRIDPEIAATIIRRYYGVVAFAPHVSGRP